MAIAPAAATPPKHAKPDIDFVALARAQGLEGIGPVSTPAGLVRALQEALALYQQGKAVLIDARVAPEYSTDMAKGMTEIKE